MSDTFHNACSHLIYHKHKIIVYFLLHNKADDRQQNSFENNGKIFPVITINNRVGYRKYIQCGACLAFSAAQNKLLRIHLLYKKNAWKEIFENVTSITVSGYVRINVTSFPHFSSPKKTHMSHSQASRLNSLRCQILEVNCRIAGTLHFCWIKNVLKCHTREIY